MMGLEQVQRLLKQRARTVGSQKRLALRLGVSQRYLSDVMHGRRLPNTKILSAMGLEWVPCYRHVYDHGLMEEFEWDETM